MKRSTRPRLRIERFTGFRRAAALIALLGLAAPAQAGKVQTWRQEGAEGFKDARRQDVVVSEAGIVRLARPLKRASEGLAAEQVWDLVRTSQGVLHAATGNEGRIYRRAPDQPAWTLLHDAPDSQVLALVVLPGDRVLAGTGPTGQVIDLGATPAASARIDPAVEYVWDLAADSEGNVYAATGPQGQLWKRAAGAASWTLLFDSPQSHLLCVAVAPDGALIAGSDGQGLIYRVAPDGRSSVLHDAPQDEIRALVVAPDGLIYAATAAAGTGSGGRTVDGGGRRGRILPATFQTAPEGARSKPPAPGENSVYRIAADHSAREVFRTKAMLHALAWQADRLLVGTGPEGMLHEVRPATREATPIARLESGQVLALRPDPDGGVWVGTGEPGQVLHLGQGHRAEGSLVSSVLDATLVSRFGAMSWTGDAPEGTQVRMALRTGNVGEPDATWSDWTTPAEGTGDAAPAVPPGRFAQYRLTLATDDPRLTPDIRALTVRYQTVNLPPEITKIEVPDLAEADGASRQTRLALKWTAADPNEDELRYNVEVRKEGWPDWVGLGGSSGLKEATYDWDTTSMPAGRYRVRITASDSPDNPAGEALEARLESAPFVVDHEAPGVVLAADGPRRVQIRLEDAWTRLVKADYALDGGEWTPLFPIDGLFDTPREALALDLPELAPGAHVLRIRATDAAGNTGAGDLLVEVP